MQDMPAFGHYLILHFYQILLIMMMLLQLRCQRCLIGSICAIIMSWATLQSLGDVLYG